jgi:hypothetical protein
MFLLSLLDGEPLLDAMPVIKTTHYPWAEDYFKPLAYARLAVVKNKGVFCDIQAFEKNPEINGADILDNSCVAVSCDFAPGSGQVLTVVLDAADSCRMYINGEAVDTGIKLSSHKSQDELGWYWNVRFYIPHTEIKNRFSVSNIQNGHKMKGNIYKFQRAGSASHMGAAAPMTDMSIFSADNLADFTVVSY